MSISVNIFYILNTISCAHTHIHVYIYIIKLFKYFCAYIKNACEFFSCISQYNIGYLAISTRSNTRQVTWLHGKNRLRGLHGDAHIM